MPCWWFHYCISLTKRMSSALYKHTSINPGLAQRAGCTHALTLMVLITCSFFPLLKNQVREKSKARAFI